LFRSGLLTALDMLKVDPQRVLWRKYLALEAIRADAFVHLYRRYHPEFATLHYHATDTLSHFYWQYYEPDAFIPSPPGRDVKRFRGVIAQAYIQADRLLGRLLKTMDRDTTLLVLSDHGQAAYRQSVPHAFLDLPTLTDFLGIWHDTSPVLIGNQHYLHFQQTELLAQTEQLLQKAFISSTRRHAFRRVSRTARCLYFELAPEVASTEKDELIVFPGHGQVSTHALRVQKGVPVTAWHTLDGIAALYGPDIRPGGRLENATILDVTPTILALFGLPVARDMTGRVWWEVLEMEQTERLINSYEDEAAFQQGGPSSLTAEERALLLDQLRDLGYI
jgi:arylsulfatase A-like enzyme